MPFWLVPSLLGAASVALPAWASSEYQDLAEATEDTANATKEAVEATSTATGSALWFPALVVLGLVYLAGQRS